MASLSGRQYPHRPNRFGILFWMTTPPPSFQRKGYTLPGITFIISIWQPTKFFFEMFGHTYHFVSFGFNILEFRFNCGNKDLITKSKDCTWKERMKTVVDYWLLNWKFISNLNSYHKFNLTKVWKNIHRTQSNKIILCLNFYESRYDFNYFIKIMS